MQRVKKYTAQDSLTQYGDGIFETLLGFDDEIHHWCYHWQRLADSCERLSIELPDENALYQLLQTALSEEKHRFSVVKLMVSRGEGLRGYRSINRQSSYIDFSIAPYAFDVTSYEGLSLRVCQTRLSSQPLLAGMKHCNRLEYIMARREIEDALFDEGLLLNYEDQIIESLVSNVFVMKDKQIITPSLDQSGVAGTYRAYLLNILPDAGYTVSVQSLNWADLTGADAVFLTNAMYGVRAVKSIQGVDRHYALAPVQPIRQLSEHPSTWV